MTNGVNIHAYRYTIPQVKNARPASYHGAQFPAIRLTECPSCGGGGSLKSGTEDSLYVTTGSTNLLLNM